MKAQFRNTAKVLALGLIMLINVNANAGTSLFTQENEPELSIENWMTDERVWANSVMETTAAIFNAEDETDLALESWMTDQSTWANDSTDKMAAIFIPCK